MATQSSTDEETYKREYSRIKTLVSSAYVRQTSVSSLNFEELEKRASESHMCFNCYVMVVIYSIYSSLAIENEAERKVFSFLCNTFLGWDQTV